MRKYFLLALTLSFSGIYAQTNPAITFELFRDNKTVEDTKAEGKPYFEDKFLTTKIEGVERTFQARYNAALDQMEIDYEDQIFVLPKTQEYASLDVRGTKFILLNYQESEGGAYTPAYFVLLNKNENISLLRRDVIRIQKAKEATTSYSSYVPARYVKNKPIYYLQLKNENVVEFPKNKKHLMNLFESDKTKISNFMSKYDVNFKDENDLIILTNFLATL